MARKVLHRARRRSSRWSHRVLVVGGREEVDALVAELEREPYAGLKVVGACMPPGDAEDGYLGAVVGSLTSVPEAVARLGVDTVAVTASRGLTSGVLKRLGWDLEGAGVDLVVAPALTDVAGPRVHVRPVSGLQLLYVEQPVHRADLGDEGSLRPDRGRRAARAEPAARADRRDHAASPARAR